MMGKIEKIIVKVKDLEKVIKKVIKKVICLKEK